MPRTNTTVFAATAGPSPGLGLTRKAGSCSRPGGSAAAGAGPRDDIDRARIAQDQDIRSIIAEHFAERQAALIDKINETIRGAFC